ncbi:NRT1-PTR FAMILY 3-1 protein [Nymphaea thermarum]|nr:NRT1-PTR FAMILY 3-1 protein [Nymphaea thermarum]
MLKGPVRMADQRQEQNGEQKRRKGGLITMPFIFANEVCEKLAVVGFGANMVSYLTLQLHMPVTKAAVTLSNFGGTASLTPLLGAFIADAYAGRFWTIAVSSIIYQIGMVCLTVSAVLPSLRPPPCSIDASGKKICLEATTSQLMVLYVSLLLTALGAGGIRPCCVAFGADQFDERDPKQSTKIWNFFNWYYFCMGFSILVAVTVIVYIQENVGWGWGLGIPTVAMFLSVITFVLGYPLYRNLKPSGSPLTRLVQVVVAATRKRKLPNASDPSLLYENEELDAPISISGVLVHSDQFKFFDKAAIVSGDESRKAAEGVNLWRLATVHRVEELKSVIRMVPIWFAGIIPITASAQQGTFQLQQGRTMDRHLSPSFQIPPGSMTVFTLISMLATIWAYDRFLIPLARRLTGLDRGISFLHRMAIGFAISVTSTFAGGFIEQRRKQAAAAAGLLDHPDHTIPISVFWLIPQYSLHGIAEAFMSIGHLEFFYDQAPESMRSTATALFWTSISAGSYLNTLLITLVHRTTDWLPDNLNRGKLEYFYWIITMLQVFNLCYYMLCVRYYTFKPLKLRPLYSSADDHVELAAAP